MNCFCGGKYQRVTQTHYWKNEYLGEFHIQNTLINKCNKCDKILLSPSIIEQMEAMENQRLESWLASRPISEFCLTCDVESILKIRRQAISKSPHIYYNLIYNYVDEHGNRRYLKKSVEKFEKDRDGRLKIFINDLENVLCSVRQNFKSKPDIVKLKAERKKYKQSSTPYHTTYHPLFMKNHLEKGNSRLWKK